MFSSCKNCFYSFYDFYLFVELFCLGCVLFCFILFMSVFFPSQFTEFEIILNSQVSRRSLLLLCQLLTPYFLPLALSSQTGFSRKMPASVSLSRDSGKFNWQRPWMGLILKSSCHEYISFPSRSMAYIITRIIQVLLGT